MILILRTVILALILSGCGSTHLTVSKVSVTPESLASKFARSPDPMQAKPPVGEKLFVSWTLPYAISPENCNLCLKVIYKDLSEESFTYPIQWRVGTVGCPLVGDKFKQTKGFFSYQAQIVTQEGEVLNTWEHQMWVNILR